MPTRVTRTCQVRTGFWIRTVIAQRHHRSSLLIGPVTTAHRIQDSRRRFRFCCRSCPETIILKFFSTENVFGLLEAIELALLLVWAVDKFILCDLALYSSKSLTTPRWPDLAATLKAFRPQASEWLGSAPCSKSATTHSSCPSWAAIPKKKNVLNLYVNKELEKELIQKFCKYNTEKAAFA